MERLADACDCHMHIYDPRFEMKRKGKAAPRPATVADYRRVQERLGLTRVVVVQSSAYVDDNSCTLDAMAQLGGNARGVGVVMPEVADAELERLTRAGIRGLRYVMFGSSPLSWESMQPMASRVGAFGWNINLQLNGEEIAERESLLSNLGADLVVDHIGRFTAPVADDSLRALHRLLDQGRCWVKLSAPYHGSKSGPPRYEDIGAIAVDLVKRWPERMLFATNWPHPSVDGAPPDDLALMSNLWEWAPDAATRQRIFVDNPAKLYGFR
jgi:D-galactarolactone isomerase